MSSLTLFEAAGGAAAFLALAADHHERCVADPELNHPFSKDDLDPEHVARLAAYVAEVMGGPPSGLEHAAVLVMHAGNGDMTDLGRRFVRCFDEAVAATLPADEALRKAFHDYMEWAVADVLAHEEVEDVPASVPVPRWTWDGLAR
jgi:hemoglobin